MANGIRIDNLNSATSLNDTDVMTIVQDKENKKLPMSLIDHDGSYSQSVINTIPDLITTSKSKVETTKQAIDEKFGEDEFSAQINTVKEMSSIGVSDDSSVNVSSQVQDGFMETAILYGKTLVNNVDADTSQDDYVAFDKDYSGQNFSISGTVEGTIKSAILKGQTLVNLLYNYSPTNNYEVKFNHQNIIGKVLIKNLYKGERCYINRFDIATNTYKGASNITSNNFIIEIPEGQYVRSVYDNNKIITADELIENGMIIKYQDGMENWDIPYFEGMQSVKMPVLKTTGKNLFDGELVKNKYYNSSVGELVVGNNNLASVNPIRVNPNTDIVLSTSAKLPNNNHYICEYASDGTFIKRTNSSKITTSETTYFIKFHFAYETINESPNVQLEEGSTATSYEPHKSNILTVNEPVELRGIGDVKDELNLLTGEVVERIGEIVLDGSEDEAFAMNVALSNSEISVFHYIKLGAKDDGLTTNIITNYLIPSGNNEPYSVRKYTNGKELMMVIPTSVASDIVTFRTYLASNPLIVQYPLATESIKTVDLIIQDQDGHITNNIHTFNETTHINTSSQGLIPEISITKSVSYDALIKPSTQYTIDLKHNDKNMTVNVGGSKVVFASGETRKTITTPSTLTNNTLSYYGLGAKANSIMLLEGNETRDLDYFNGMKSVKYTTHEDGSKMPILSTVGKNLFNADIIKGNRSISTGEMFVQKGYATTTDFIPISSNQKISLSLKNTNKYRFSQFLFYDDDKSFISNSTLSTVTTPTNAKFIHIGLAKLDTTNDFTEDELVELKDMIQIEYGNKTSYEPYKTSILSTENDLIMRSNGSIRDSLDLITGKFIQRIGEDGNILATPIETTIDINTNLGDEKLPIVYKNGHILLQSDELTPELKYSIPISYSGLIAQNTMTNLRHSWRLDELELLAYASIVNSQYDSLILVSTAETNEIMVSSDYVPDVSLYNMLKVLVDANALQNADEKISTFYLYGKLSDEMFIDLIMGDDM